MARVEFTNNYQDLSTGNGFQFKFICESCGNGYISSWKPNTAGIAGSVLRGAGSILGGIFGRAASGSYQIQEAIGGPAHDSAPSSAPSAGRRSSNAMARTCRLVRAARCVDAAELASQWLPGRLLSFAALERLARPIFSTKVMISPS